MFCSFFKVVKQHCWIAPCYTTIITGPVTVQHTFLLPAITHYRWDLRWYVLCKFSAGHLFSLHSPMLHFNSLAF